MQAGYTNCQQSSQLVRHVGSQDVCVYQSAGGANPPHCPNAFVEVARTNRRFPIENSTICPAGVPRDWAAASPCAPPAVATPADRRTFDEWSTDPDWSCSRWTRLAERSRAPGVPDTFFPCGPVL